MSINNEVKAAKVEGNLCTYLALSVNNLHHQRASLR